MEEAQYERPSYLNCTSQEGHCNCWKGLLHKKPCHAASFFFYAVDEEYELTLDRPSLRKWFTHRQQQHSSNISSSPFSDRYWDTVLRAIMDLLKEEEEHGGCKHIASLFLSMDIFSQVSDDRTTIDSFFEVLRDALPNVQTVHLYNPPPPFPIDRSNHEDDDEDRSSMENRGDSTINDGPVILIPAETLRWLLSPSLQSFIATRCVYFSDPHDVLALAEVVRRCSFSTFHLLSMYLAPDRTVDMDPLLMALYQASSSSTGSNATSLESLNITVCHPDMAVLPSVRWISTPSRSDPTRRIPSPRKEEDAPTMVQAFTNTPTDPTRGGVVISPIHLRRLIQHCPALIDLTLWECQLQDAHLEAIQWALSEDPGAPVPPLECDDASTTTETTTGPQLRFLSLRENPGISQAAWCRFYTQALPHCYSLQSIYNDHVCGLADCHPNLPVYGEPDRTGGPRFWDAHTTATAEAELLLGLNALGRGEVLRSFYCNNDDARNDDHLEARDGLVDLLADVTDTPSAIYTLLRSHPMMMIGPLPGVNGST